MTKKALAGVGFEGLQSSSRPTGRTCPACASSAAAVARCDGSPLSVSGEEGNLACGVISSTLLTRDGLIRSAHFT